MDVSWAGGIPLVLFAYLLGAVPFGILVARAFDRNVDIRRTGSGNIGATNVLRSVGRAAGALTLLLDAGKGAVALAVAERILSCGGALPPEKAAWLAPVGAAAFLGHIFPVYLGFRGGKGVATALGILLYLSPAAALVLLVLFLAVTGVSRYVSLGSLAAATVLPFTLAVPGEPHWKTVLGLTMSILVFYTHRENIARLRAGNERKVGAPKEPPAGR